MAPNNGPRVIVKDNKVFELIVPLDLIDRQDLEKIYSTSFKNFFSYAYMLISSKDDAHDIVQTVFSKLFIKTENNKSFKAENLEAYIVRSIRNEFINRNKKAIRRQNQLQQVQATSPSAEDSHLNANQNSSLRELIKNLPTVQRSCITLYFFHDMSYAEIAHELGITSSSVRTHMQRAKLKLASKVTKD